jgi:hypothetical protein
LRITTKLFAAGAAAALALVGPAAIADTFYNDLETPITVDTALERMNLTYDTLNSLGTNGSATIAIQVNGQPVDDVADHPGCNIQGGHHFVSLSATSTNTAIATVLLSNSGTFDACTDTITATVTSQSVGDAVINFAVDDADTETNGDPHLNFLTSQADFEVHVTEGAGTPPVGCDADPAAPAWAAAILQKSGVKAYSKDWNNAIAYVAHIMTNAAVYQGYAKNAHPDYENAVRNTLAAYLPHKTIVSAQAAARPGWTCLAIS